MRIAPWVALGVALACQGTVETTDVVESDSGPPIAERRLAHAAEITAGLRPIAAAFCARQFRCCNDGELALDFGPLLSGEASCADELLEALRYDRLSMLDPWLPKPLTTYWSVANALDPDRVTVDGDAAAECAGAVDAEPCNPKEIDPCAPPEDALVTACAVRHVFVGHGGQGATCGSGWDSTSVDCAPGLECLVSDPAGGICHPEPSIGPACVTDDDCGAGVCDGRTGTCVAGLAAGASCAFRAPDLPVTGTELEPCGRGLRCDQATLKCATRACARGCLRADDCVDSPCVAGQCLVAPPAPDPGAAVGSECDASTPCAATAYCDPPGGGPGRCAAKKPRGSLCGARDECASDCRVQFGEARCVDYARPGCTGR